MIREKEKNNKEGRLWRLKKFEEESYREAVSSIQIISAILPKCMYSQCICVWVIFGFLTRYRNIFPRLPNHKILIHYI